jgi:hypothetical protein
VPPAASIPQPPFRDDDRLYRYVLDCHIHEGRVTDAHCQTKHWLEGLSCDWSRIREPRDTVKTLPGYVLSITVGQCMALGLTVVHRPIEGNPAHCELLLPPGATTKTEVARIRAKFLTEAVLLLVERERTERVW